LPIQDAAVALQQGFEQTLFVDRIIERLANFLLLQGAGCNGADRDGEGLTESDLLQLQVLAIVQTAGLVGRDRVSDVRFAGLQRG